MKKRILSLIFAIISVVTAVLLLGENSVLILISIAIITFLLIYKLTDFVSGFKLNKKISIIDTVFIGIFFVLLVIPISYIDNSVNAKNENRRLAPKPNLITSNGINPDFGNDFNNWFNDRFAFRTKIIRSNVGLKCIISANSCTNGDMVFDKKHNLVYRNYNFWGMKPLGKDKDNAVKTYITNLNKLHTFCKNRNIKLYFLIVPRQCDYFDFELGDLRKEMPDPADEIVEELKSNTNVKILYPKGEMADVNKFSPVFFKTDHHWTKKGALVCYQALMKEIKKDFPNLPIVEENDLEKYHNKKVSEWWNKELNPGQTYKHMGLPKFYSKFVLDTDYVYYKNPEASNLKVIENGFAKDKIDAEFYYPKGLDKKLLIIGDSFGCNFMEFAPYSFKNSLYLYNNPRGLIFEKYNPIIDEYKPDVLVLLFYTPNIPKLSELYSKK